MKNGIYCASIFRFPYALLSTAVMKLFIKNIVLSIILVLNKRKTQTWREKRRISLKSKKK